MNLPARTLEALDWDFVLASLASRARTRPGAEAARALEPFDAAHDVVRIFDAIDELLALRELQIGAPPLAHIEDIGATLERATRGQVLELDELVDAAITIIALAGLARFFTANSEHAPSLARMARGISIDPALARTLDAAFDQSGGLSAKTYPKLAELRARIAALEKRIRRELDALLAGSELDDVLQDRFVSVRGDRFVVPVRAQAKNLGLGIVHDASRTGQTVYIEPNAVVPMGNERRMAEAALAAEEQRILRDLSALVAEHGHALRLSLAAAVEIDLVHARRELGLALEATRPKLSDSGDVRLREARHPILVLEGIEVVANDLTVDAGQPVLVLTGPNAGGKTIALKTIGLCAALVRIGCFVPAAGGSTMPVFSEVLADIGDQQTVHGGLSSFSGHLTTLHAMLERAGKGVLLLLDEIASGTDPSQGGALARALLERFADVGARTVVTTHYAQVKAMSAADSRVAVAAMEYADDQPTYRVVAGMAGESHALSAAQHVGLDDPLIERARSLMDEGERALHDALTDLEAERERSESLRRRLEAMTEELEAREVKIAAREARVREGAAKLEREAAHRMIERARAAEREIGQVVAELQKAPSHKGAEAARDAVDTLRGAVPVDEPAPARAVAEASPIGVGDHVRVIKLDATGVVSAVTGKRIELRIGSMTTRVTLDEVEKVGGPARPKQTKQRVGLGKRSKEPAVALTSAIRHEANTCDLRGERVVDALAKLDEFLDQAVLAGHDFIFVLHGHGTNAVKKAVREAFARSPYVGAHARAEDDQGGDAFTVARIVG
jgi:DNA mismatch repair protein MutS2